MEQTTHRQTKAKRERSVMDMSDRLTTILMSSLLWKTSSSSSPGSAVLITAEVAACPIGFSEFLFLSLTPAEIPNVKVYHFSPFSFLLFHIFVDISVDSCTRREVEILRKTLGVGLAEVGSLRYGLLLVLAASSFRLVPTS